MFKIWHLNSVYIDIVAIRNKLQHIWKIHQNGSNYVWEK